MFFAPTRKGRSLGLSGPLYSPAVAFMPTSAVSLTPDFGFAFSIASIAASGFLAASSSERVAARMKRLTTSGLFLRKSFWTMMPELTMLMP